MLELLPIVSFGIYDWLIVAIVAIVIFAAGACCGAYSRAVRYDDWTEAQPWEDGEWNRD